MARCHTCGNDYDKSFDIHYAGKVLTFDSFECAIQAMAPICAHCSCRIIGHGVEADASIFCCAHCAAKQGHPEITDRSDSSDSVKRVA